MKTKLPTKLPTKLKEHKLRYLSFSELMDQHFAGYREEVEELLGDSSISWGSDSQLTLVPLRWLVDRIPEIADATAEGDELGGRLVDTCELVWQKYGQTGCKVRDTILYVCMEA